MKFEGEFCVDNYRNPVAILYHFDGGPDLCLAIAAQGGKTVWLYPSGLTSIQHGGFDVDSDIVRKFYPGDKITITF